VNAPSLLLLADRVRAELVGRGHIPVAVFDGMATQAVRNMWAVAAAELHVEQRLTYVLRQLSGWMPSEGQLRDAQIALGEYETLLCLRREAAA
jgi:hypothetical protein